MRQGGRVALVKTRGGPFSRTTDCVTPPFPLNPPAAGQPLFADLQTPPPPTTAPNQQQQVTTGRMITTSIDEGVRKLTSLLDPKGIPI